MKLNLKQVVLNPFTDKPLTVGSIDDEKKIIDLTLQRVCVEALISSDPQNKATAIQMFERTKLAKKLSNVDEIDLEVTEVAKLKERIGEAYRHSGVIIESTWTMLEG